MTALALAPLLGGCLEPSRQVGRYPEPIFETRPRPAPTPPPIVKPPEPTRGGLAGKTIIIDAGHGGRDPGASGVGPVVEKHVNLAVAGQLVRLLQERGARVVTTRSTDTFIELDARAAMADRYRTDLFVSIHADSAKNASASGSTVYIARNASRDSVHAGQAIAAALRRAGIESRGVQRAGFRVLVGHSRPAVLVECGFLTNRRDATNLSQSSYQAKVAAAIADGILAYFR